MCSIGGPTATSDNTLADMLAVLLFSCLLARPTRAKLIFGPKYDKVDIDIAVLLV